MLESMELNAPQTVPTVDPPLQTPVAPPAATVVTQGSRTERESDLERQLDEERQARRKAETDAAYAQDEARRLKDIQTARPEPPKAKRAPLTFFDEEEA